jgi:hypothetical protein
MTMKNGRIAEIGLIVDPERMAQLDIAELGE